MSALPTIVSGGQVRPLGCRPRVAAVGTVFPVFDDQIPLLPRSQWQAFSMRHLIAAILDQDGEGACNAFAAVQSLHGCRALMGLPYTRLSPGNLYGRINGGSDNGSMMGDALVELEKRGVCTAATVPELEWRPARWPSGWQQEATGYKILEAYDCPTFDHIGTALLCGFFVDYGILVGDNFEPDAAGVLPPYRRGGGGHAMCGLGLKQIGGVWHVETANSWGTAWGDAGFCYVPESYFSGTFNDSWAVRAVVVPEG